MNVPDNNEGEERVIDPAMAIESLDDYIRRYGLPSGNGDGQAGGEFNGLTRLEATERVRAEEAYRDKVINEHQAQQGTPPQENNYDTPRLDEDCEGAVISVLLADKSTHTMPVQPLIAFCETARRMVTSRWRYGVRHGVADDSGMDATEPSANANATAPSQEAGGDEESPIMELSLVEFDAEAVVQFMHVLISLHDHQQKEKEVSSGARDKASRKRRMNDGTDETTNEQIMSLIDEGKISEQHIVECLKLAHFLQCTVILETLIPIVHLSIDSHNCMAICSLSDALNLKSLFEASVNYVIERLDVFQGTTSPGDSEGGTEQNRSSSSSNSDDDGEQEEIWASLPYELRSRVLTMRNVMRSSVIGRGSKVSGLFFSSGSEFLGKYLHPTPASTTTYNPLGVF